MENPEEMVLKLNKLLEADQFNRNEFEILIKLLKEKYKTDIKFLDFEYYNEDRLRMVKEEKIENVKSQDFETAAKFRDLEKECLNYISIKTDYNIEKSTFYYDPDYLFYFCLGTAKNDKIVREYLNE